MWLRRRAGDRPSRVSFGTDTALVPVHLESQTQEEQLVLRVLAADTEEPVRGALFVVELIDGDGQKTVCKDWDLDGVITTEAMPEGDYTAHLRTLAGFLMPEDTVVTGGAHEARGHRRVGSGGLL